MNWKDRQRRFSIRKLKVAVASVMVGMLGFGLTSPAVAAQTQAQLVASDSSQILRDVSYRYVKLSELTAAERAQLVANLPSDKVGAYDTYYMVYRPVGQLPQTGGQAGALATLLGTGLLLVGVTLSKNKKKRIIASLLILSLGEVTSVAALPQASALSSYDQTYQLRVGETLPTTVIDIPNHVFVGYLLPGNSEATRVSGPITPSGESETASPTPRQSSQMASTTTPVAPRRTSGALESNVASLTPTSVPGSSSASSSRSASAKLSSSTSQSLVQSAQTSIGSSERTSSSAVPASVSASSAQSNSTSPTVQPSSSAAPASQSEGASLSASMSSSHSASAKLSSVVSQSLSQSAPTSIGSSERTSSSAVLASVSASSAHSSSTSPTVQPSSSVAPASQSEGASLSTSVSSSHSVSAKLSSVVSQSLSQSAPTSIGSSERTSSSAVPASVSVSSAHSSSTSPTVQPSSSAAPASQSEGASLSASVSVSVVDQLSTSTSQAISEQAPAASQSVVNSTIVQPPHPSAAPQPVTPVEKIETEVLAFETIYKEDPTLPLGSEKVLQEGVPGQKRKRYVDGVLVSEEIVAQPINRIVARGTQPADQPAPKEPVETEAFEAIAFTTDYREDPTLPLGSEKVLQEGVPGQKRKRYVDGVLVSEEIVTQPINRIVARGTQPVDQPAPTEPVETEAFEAIAFTTDYREDPTLPLGSEKVLQEGVPGQKRKRYVDGVLVSEEIVTQPINRIIARGTQPVEDQPVAEPVVTTEAIPFETESIEDSNLPLGQEELVQSGVPGVRELKTLNGQVISSQVIQAPVNQIIKRGTKVVVPDQPVAEPVVTTEAIPFETESIEDSNLPLGQEELVQAGVPGIRELKTLNGQVISSQVLQAPVNQIIKRGTKVTPVTETRQVALPFETIYQDDATLAVGQEEVIQEGQAGLVAQTWENGQLVGETILQQPVNQIIKRGTKVAPVTETRQVALPFETIYQDDATLAVGQEEVIQEGQAGLAEQTWENGQLVAEKIVTQPVNRIIKRGTKVTPTEGTEVETSTVPIAPEVIRENDDNLWLGETQATPGTEGEMTITTTYTTLDGVRQPNPTVTEVVTRPAIPTVIKVGTKPIEGTEVETETVEIDFETLEELDDSQYTDYEVVRIEGEIGSKTVTTTYETIKGVRQPNPTVSEAITKEAVDRVVVKGTKPIEGEVTQTRTETVDFTVRTVEDPDQYTDYRKEEGGEVGEKTITEVFKTIKGDITTEVLRASETETKAPVEKVVTIGTKPIEGEVSETSERPLAFDIQYEDDPTLLVGTEKVKQAGQDGLARVTLTYKTIKGEKSGEPTETLEVVTPAMSQIILRGTKVETEADKQTPLLADKQVVKQGETPEAKASIQTADLKNVASYDWVSQPATDQVGTDLPGRVRVTYTDGSSDELDVVIDVIAQKEKPVLTYEHLIELDDERKISLDYALDDPTSAYTGAVISIYDGETLVKSFPLSTLEAFDVTDLDWHVKYTLKTQYTYDLEDGNGSQTVDLDDRFFELDYKHLEIKHVVSAGLYQKQADGSYLKLDTVKTLADNLDDYYVRVASDKQRDIYLPVTAMEETTFDDKPVFKVTTTAPELIQYDDALGDNQANYSFYIRKFVPSSDGKYRTFTDLVTAIQADLSGTFELDADLNADEVSLAANAVSYIVGNFTGRLLGNNHAIFNLKAPLFEHLQNQFDIRDVDLKQVNINQSQADQVGALAKTAYGNGQGRISNVAVEGSILANRSVGGLVYRSNNTQLEQVAFEGQITAMNGYQPNFVGGLIGYAQNNTQITGASTNAQIKVGMNYNFQRAGGLIGVLEHATSRLTDVVAQGRLDNSAGNTAAYIGGLVGETIGNPQISNALTGVQVVNGQMTLGNPANKPTGTLDIATIDGLASGTADTYSTVLSQAEAKAKQDSMNLTVTLADSAIDYSRYEVDYAKVKQAEAGHLLKYANVEKFMPLYNKEFIVKHGNRLADDHELATKTIVSIIPMAGDRFVANYGKDKTAIDQIMVYFADGSKSYYQVSYLEDFKNTGVAEYQVQGLDLIYTPEQLLTTYPKLAAEVLPALSGIEYYSDSLLAALGKTGDTQEMMDRLYLKSSFDSIKANLADVLNGVLATSDVMATDQTDVSAYILKNKEALLMGLAYVNRWFNIDFGEVNAKDLILYHQDLFGKSTNTLEWLVSLGQSYEQLRMINHLDTYDTATRAQSGHDTLFDYLSAYRKLFTDMDENTWFHAASKVYMAEGASEVRPDVEVRAYQRLLNDSEARKYILPFLTAREGIFFITNMSTLNFGMYDRYMDMSLKDTDPAKYVEEVKRVEALIEAANKRYVDHFDFWYRMSLDTVKERNIKSVPNWDGYYLNRDGANKNQWLPMFGEGANDAILDFFGPIDGSLSSHYESNGSGAYATGNMTRFVIDRLLDNYGSSVHTHEMVHNSDATIYLGGYGRRFGQRAELFATGFLQAPTGHDSAYLSINHLFDYTDTEQAEADNRYQPLSPDRFQTADDLQEYFHGVFDVLYTMDYLEAQAVLSLDKDQQRKFYNKIENYYVQDVDTQEDTHAGNQIRPFTDEEWASMNLTSVMDLVEHDVISTRDYALSASETAAGLKTYGRNGYYTISLFSPIYSALHNANGAPGDVMFRLMAYELLAAKGYEEGFLPYASNQLADEAKARGITGTETWPSKHTVGRVTDDLVLETVFDGEYASWKDFKKAMYQERMAKVDRLKAVTITFNGQEVVIDSVQQIEDLMSQALQEDLRRFMGATTNIDANNRAYAQNSRVKELKAKIFNAYLRQTNDFRESIYTGN